MKEHPQNKANTLRHSRRETGYGQGLESGLRSQMERFYGVGLGHVRVHSDTVSRSRADDIGARAFTIGSDVFMGTDGLRATGADRSGLMAHEVAHTLQQGRGGTALQASAENPRHGARLHEREAEHMATDFNRFLTAGSGKQPQSPRAARLLSPAPAGAVQASFKDTHFGRFEDVRYAQIEDGAGDPIGVEIYLKFHPGNNVNATKIGLTQAAEGKFNGTQIRSGIYGQRSQAAGDAAGYFIDRIDGYPNPIYPTKKSPSVGGSADELADYPFDNITQKNNPIIEGVKNYKGWGDYGYRYRSNNAIVDKPADLYDAPFLDGAGANSEQIFETTALAIDGAQKGTYYGSVKWGWKIDASGTFGMEDFDVVSQGVPTLRFLTAARLWNDSLASFGYRADGDIDMIDMAGTVIATIPDDTALNLTGNGGNDGVNNYAEVTYGADTGFILVSSMKESTVGADTVNLPLVDVFRTTGVIQEDISGHDILEYPTNPVSLPAGQRVRIISQPTVDSPGRIEVVDGQYTGLTMSITSRQMTLLGPDTL